MREAFAALGYEVVSVTGYLGERADAARSVLAQARKGRPFAFAYSETQSLPMPLTEPHHLPVRPFHDYRFLGGLKDSGVPVGIFYRDTHWRFPELTADLSGGKRLYLDTFHHLEYRQLRRSVDHLFLPSLRMAVALPTPWPEGRLSALPPGLTPQSSPKSRTDLSQLRLLYVGGVTPPLYDLTPLFSALAATPAARLTLCCRPEEWARSAPSYEVPSNVTVVHGSGDELVPLYAAADAAAILWEPHPYLDITLPVKLFEAMAYGLPIITTPGTETARFVADEDVGWVVDDAQGFSRLVGHLQASPSDFAEAEARVEAARERHTWAERARQVAETLTRVEA